MPDEAKILYEPEADVLTWQLNQQDIDYASEVGNVIVHFTKDHKPVLLEFLDASKFLRQAENIIGPEKIHQN